jgi:DNA-binding response OmpR family regulator
MGVLLGRRSSLRVLWIDAGTASCAVTWLMAQGFAVDWAADGRTGLAKARGLRFDVIVLELQLPDMSGVEVLQVMRAECIYTPALVLTGVGAVDVAVASMKAGATEYRTKPLSNVDLTSTLVSLAETSSACVNECASLALDDWAWHVWRPAAVHREPKTLADWGRACGRQGETALREVSLRVGLDARMSRNVAHLLYALHEHNRTGESLESFISVADPRTLKRLLARGGIMDSQNPLSISDFLSQQRFIAVDHPAIAALRRLLRAGDRPYVGACRRPLESA